MAVAKKTEAEPVLVLKEGEPFPDLGIFYQKKGPGQNPWVSTLLSELVENQPVKVTGRYPESYNLKNVRSALYASAKGKDIPIAIRAIGDDLWICRLKKSEDVASAE